jgi:hypothetical protein
MDRSYSIKKRTTGFWFFSRNVLDIEVKIINGKVRFLLENTLQALSRMVPEIRYIKSETPLVSGLRGGLKRTFNGSHNDHHDLIILKGYIETEQMSENLEDKDKIAFCHTLSSSFDSFDTVKNTILYRLYSTITPEFTSFKERVSLIDTVRNASFELEKCTLCLEKYLFSNVISRWCNIPAIDLSINLSVTDSSMNLRIELDPLLQKEDLQILASLFEVISDYLLTNGEESFYPSEVLKTATG